MNLFLAICGIILIVGDVAMLGLIFFGRVGAVAGGLLALICLWADLTK